MRIAKSMINRNIIIIMARRVRQHKPWGGCVLIGIVASIARRNRETPEVNKASIGEWSRMCPSKMRG